MKSSQKPIIEPRLSENRLRSQSASTASAISKKLLEIKRISGAGEMTELNMALFKHLK